MWGENSCVLGGENGKGAWEFLCPARILTLLCLCSTSLSLCFACWWRRLILCCAPPPETTPPIFCLKRRACERFPSLIEMHATQPVLNSYSYSSLQTYILPSIPDSQRYIEFVVIVLFWLSTVTFKHLAVNSFCST